MHLFRSFLGNFSRSLAFACIVVLPLHALSAVAAGEKSTVILTDAVAKPLKAAQDSIRKKQWSTALDQIAQAQAVEKKTPEDQYGIDKLSAYVLYQEKNYAEAAAAYEKLLNSPLLPEKETDGTLKTMVELRYRSGNDADTVRSAKKYLEKHPADLDVLELEGQSYYRMKEWKQSVTAMEAAVAATEREGKSPRESWLRVLERCYYELDDQAGKDRTQLKLVHYFKETDDWNALLDANLRKAASEGARLEYHRLMLDSNRLTTPQQYEEVALESMDAGLPAEAQRIIEHGISQGVFKGGEELAGRHERLLSAAKEAAQVARANLDALAKQASAAKRGQDDVALGLQYLSYGENDEAIAALERGLKKGSVSDVGEAKISLGRAYEEAGKKQLAAQTFRGVAKESKWSVLAELWASRVENGAIAQTSNSKERSAASD